ncbi:pseudouridine synthase [Kiloniella litopenaei]|uniref:pseudouridine synthase n=1 Tax=Kiloniella litopenaei TaxID=1549748 RepID=UPI0009E649C4|nr:pseudouridine synthase [Kiloniella litopenaei]
MIERKDKKPIRKRQANKTVAKTKVKAAVRKRGFASAPSRLLYVALYKPYDVLSQFTGEAGQRTLAEIDLPLGVYAAGRLDKDSEGLLLLSNDGPFIDRLIHPKNGHPRSYLVQVERVPDDGALDQLRSGVIIKGYQTKPCTVELLTSEPDLPSRTPPIRERKNIPTAWLKITLSEGKNRQVRRMTAAVGFPTLRLVRESIGNLKLDGLQPGEWKIVSTDDIL